MYSQETIEALNKIRLAGLREASEKRDVDALMSWHAKDAVFTNVVHGITREGIDSIREFYSQAYSAMPTFRIIESKATGFTPEFVATEMRCEGETTVDLPHIGLKAGETLYLVGVSLFWWKWEGEGEQWDGDLSPEGVRGWKVVRERSYYNFANKAST